MSTIDNIDGIYAKDTELRTGINTLRSNIVNQTIKPLTITQNNTTYTADPTQGTYGYSPITVDVNVPVPSVATKHIRGNGIFSAADDNVAGYSDVIVDGASNNAYYHLVTLNDPSNLTVRLSMTGSSKGGAALIQWGDGEETYMLNDNMTYTYSATGTYAISIYPIKNTDATCITLLIGNSLQSPRVELLRLPNYQASRINNGSATYGWILKGVIRVILPLGITQLGDMAFSGNSELEEVYMQDITPPTMSYSWSMPFSECPKLSAIYVPTEAVSAYKTASGWSAYADIIQPMPL